MPALLLLTLLAQTDARLTFLSRQLGQAKDPRARAQAALVLGNLEEPAAVRTLCDALDDASELVRSASARSLGKLVQTSALDCLERHAGDRSLEVRSSVRGAMSALMAALQRPPSVYIAFVPQAQTSTALASELWPFVEERLRVKIAQLGARVAPPGETKSQARNVLGKLGVKGFLLRPEVSPQPGGAVVLRLLCLTYPDKAILGEVSVQASGAPAPDLIRALVPRALEDAAQTFEWRQ